MPDITQEWDPETDEHTPAPFCADDLAGKAECKAALQAELGFEVNHEVRLWRGSCLFWPATKALALEFMSCGHHALSVVLLHAYLCGCPTSCTPSEKCNLSSIYHLTA